MPSCVELGLILIIIRFIRYLNNISYKKAKFVGDKGLILSFFRADSCSFLSLFNILCIAGIADFLYLALNPLFTWYKSFPLVFMLCCLLRIGNRCLKLSTLRLFFANLRQSISLLSESL